MAIKAQRPPADQQNNPHVPPGPEPLVFEQFQGINTSTTRAGVKDEEMWWCDGFFPLGPRELRTLWGVGTELWNVSQSLEPAGTTISWYDFANIGTTPYCIVFLSNGSIYAVNTATAAFSRIAPAGTMSSPSRLDGALAQYGSQYVLIVARQANGYFIWDGTTFFVPGDMFPPESSTIPTAIGGNAIEVYTGRVWIANGPLVTFSAPGKVTDFTGMDGGGTFQSSDSFLRVGFTQLRQSNGFLYLIADSSVNYISGVQTGGSPLVTTFTNQNADPEVGSPWPGTVVTFGRNILFANSFGAHVSYGAAVTKISEQLDGVYQTVTNFNNFVPSSAKAVVFGKKIWILLLPIIDPVSGQQVNKLLIWNGKIWFASVQDVSPITFIQHQEIASVLTAWMTNGQGIWPMFQQPSIGFQKVVQSRLWDKPGGYEQTKATSRLWGLSQFFAFSNEVITVSIDNETGNTVESDTRTITPGLGPMTWTGAGGAPLTWTGAGGAALTWLSASGAISVFAPQAVGQNGVLMGFTVKTNSPDWALISIKMQPEIVAYRG